MYNEIQSDSVPTDQRVFDLAAVMNLVDGELELVEQLAEMLIDDLPAQTTRLREGVVNGDSEEVRMVTHRLKSSVGNLGGRRAHAMIRELEQLARSERLNEAAGTLDQCESELHLLQSELQQFLAR